MQSKPITGEQLWALYRYIQAAYPEKDAFWRAGYADFHECNPISSRAPEEDLRRKILRDTWDAGWMKAYQDTWDAWYDAVIVSPSGTHVIVQSLFNVLMDVHLSYVRSLAKGI